MSVPCWVIAAGPAEQQLALAWLRRYHHWPVAALDGGMHWCQHNHVLPRWLLGDFDSFQDEAKCQRVYLPDQRYTDLEKAAHWLLDNGQDTLFVWHALGGRVDHLLYNLRLLHRFGQAPKLYYCTDHHIVEWVSDCTVTVFGEPGSPCAVMALPKQACVTAQGLRYAMRQHDMQYGEGDSVSNQLIDDRAELTIAGAAVVMHPLHEQFFMQRFTLPSE